MPISRNLKDGVLTIKDAGSNTCVLVLEEGDLRFTESKTPAQVSDRGVLDHVRKGPEQPVGLSFTTKYYRLYTESGESGAGMNPTPYEALKGVGQAAAWVSVFLAEGSDVYGVKLEFLLNNPKTTGADELITFNRVYYTNFEFAEGEDYDTLSVEAVDYETEPTITGVPA